MNNEILKGLNDKQKEAVELLDGPVMAIAGAGSGKTSVLTRRFVNLIYHHVNPKSILAVTFTNKAADEMKERIVRMVGGEFPLELPWVGTFHSICNHILRLEYKLLPEGLNSNFEILDADDSKSRLKETLRTIEEECPKFEDMEEGEDYYELAGAMSDNVQFDEDNFPLGYVQDIISKMKNKVDVFLNEDEQAIYDTILRRYNRLLREENCVDFDDLLLLAYEIFEENPEVLAKYQKIFRYVMIDEFQDTNNLQYMMVKLIAEKHRNLFIVGDEDQSIYAFRGANIANIKHFQKDFPEFKAVVLAQNYRSTSNILDNANAVISNNEDRIPKDLFTDKKGGEKVKYCYFENSYKEREFIVSEIRRIMRYEGYNYNDFAVLYRVSAMSRNIEEGLLRAGIPYKVFGGQSYFSRKEVKDVIAYLRLLVFDSPNSFRRVVNVPARKIGKATLDKLNKKAEELDVTPYEAIDSFDNKNLKEFKNLIEDMRSKIDDYSLKGLIDLVVEETGYKDVLMKDRDGKERLQNIMEFKSVFDEMRRGDYDTNNTDILKKILQEITLKTENDGDERDDGNYVSVMTMHQAKGLEFRCVFVIGFEDTIFPNEKAVEEGQLEEERRLCYVSITRAKEKLYLTTSINRLLYGTFLYNMPSIFIKELDFTKIEKKIY